MDLGARDILIGWASRDVSPGGNVSLWGMHYVRLTEEVHDPLTATALALSSSGRPTAWSVWRPTSPPAPALCAVWGWWTNRRREGT